MPQLSKRAQALYKRLHDPSRWYPAYAKGRAEDGAKESRAMQELVKAGLVEVQGRVMKCGAYYVPKGTVAFELERLPNDKTAHETLRRYLGKGDTSEA